MTWKWVTIILAAAILAAGCATTPQQTATEQIIEQTTDPIAIGKALVLDAEDAFIAAWEAYSPNRMVIQARHPEQAQQLDRAFKRPRPSLTYGTSTPPLVKWASWTPPRFRPLGGRL
jgi:hypothetical protein